MVAKRNMGDGLLLVGRLVDSAAAAVQAAKEGANYVVLQVCGLSWHLNLNLNLHRKGVRNLLARKDGGMVHRADAC